METPAEVAQKLLDFSEAYPDADYTFAHVLIADYNMSNLLIFKLFDTQAFRDQAQIHIMEEDDPFEIEKHYITTAETMKFLRYLQNYDDAFLDQVAEILYQHSEDNAINPL
jgi:hypothetical protein